MADRSAAALAEAVLCRDPAEAAQTLANPLAGDPALVLWAVCRASGGLPTLCTLQEVAQWLGAHAVEVLQWEADASELEGLQTSAAEPLADLVTASLQTADLAALLAAADGRTASEEARLLGLLHNAEPWLALTAADDFAGVADCLPDWLQNLNVHPSARYVAQALELLAGRVSAEPLAFTAQACRQRAIEGRSRWLEIVNGPGARLPALMARLARLEQLEQRFQEAVEAEKLAAMAELAAGAGHEINNPLAIIAGRAQLFLREETDPERRRELALINAQVKRAHEMIADMRLFARPPKPEPERLDLAALVDAVIADLAGPAAEQAISLARTGVRGPVPIEADPAQLNVALRALCKNAMEAIGQGGHIEIALEQRAQEAVIRVSDDGPGFAPEVRRHIFDPFYSARQAGRGLGLGLSKCWRIVTGHGGRIDVQSEPGRGATFTITLPRGEV